MGKKSVIYIFYLFAKCSIARGPTKGTKPQKSLKLTQISRKPRHESDDARNQMESDMEGEMRKPRALENHLLLL